MITHGLNSHGLNIMVITTISSTAPNTVPNTFPYMNIPLSTFQVQCVITEMDFTWIRAPPQQQSPAHVHVRLILGTVVF